MSTAIDFANRDGAPVVAAMVRAIEQNAIALSDIDGAIGDGDHGINMKKGFAMCAERLAGKSHDLTEGIMTLGSVLMGEIGGAMGPLYGTFFREMGKASKGRERIDAEAFEAMLQAGVNGVVALGGARVGDKTLIDTLQPALEALTAANRAGEPFAEALDAMVDAAERGRDSTRELVAKLGRSSRLGERSRGVLDAGAASSCLLLTAMAEAIKALLSGSRA